METIVHIVQVVIAFGIINVWILRFKKETDYRGGHALNLIEEFEVYGLPVWFYYLIGFLKVLAAHILLAGIWIPSLVPPTSALIAVLMLGAVAMHLKVKDPLIKILPALAMFVMSGFVCAMSLNQTI